MRKPALFRGLLVLCILLLAGLSLYTACTVRTLETTLSDIREQLRQAEEARISQAYAFQKELEAVGRTGAPETEAERRPAFADALRAGEIKSVLIIGDSISDGNGDTGCLYTAEERAAADCRKIGEIDGKPFYENAWDSQGWAGLFRNYLLENTSVEVFHNNAIGGKSAKWGNAHKEAWISRDYDAIFVMLGTNDRSDCANAQEFYTEYAQLLRYAESRCQYLTVLTPIPAFTTVDSATNLDTRQIADAVLELCAANGYDCVNCYAGLLEYASDSGCSLSEYLPTDTHPNHLGYLAIYRVLMEALGLNPPIGDVYSAREQADVIHLGMNREDITESTRLTAVDAGGRPIFPEGFSVYYTWNAFGQEIPYGAVITTSRDGESGYQIARIGYYSYDLTRSAGADGQWSDWTVIDQTCKYPGQIR